MQPRASRTEVLGWREGVLRLRVTASPVDGQANQAVVALLAVTLGVPGSALQIVRGEGARDKVVHVRGLTLAETTARITTRVGGSRG